MGVAYHPPIFTLRCGPYFSNFSANAQTVDISAVGTSGMIESLSAPSLSTYIIPSANLPPNVPTPGQVTNQTSKIANGQVTLPPYSVNRIFNIIY